MTPSLLRHLADHAHTRPDGVALRFPADERVGDRVVTWSDLHGLVGANAARMQAQGVEPGQTVLIVHASTFDQTVVFLAAIAAGAVPTIMSYPSARQSRERFLATLGPLVERFGPEWMSVAAPWRALLGGLGPKLLDETVDGGAMPWPDVIRCDDRLFLQFSSGTTGLRKGVAITGAMLEHQLDVYGRRLAVRPSDVIVSWLPLYHDMGLVAAFLFGIHHGLPATHISPFAWLRDPISYLRAISTEGGTLSHIPNFGLNFLATRADVSALAAERVSLSSLRALVDCSEPVRADSVRAFTDHFAPLGLKPSAMQASYAMAECTFAVTQTQVGLPPRIDRVDRTRFLAEHVCVPAEGDAVLEFVSCGVPVDDISVCILGTPEERQIGEIAIHGPSVVEGYVAAADAEATGDAFDGQGWFRTGDLGYLADGHLYVTGRSKDLVICRGHNVYPNDVEETLGQVPGCKVGRVVVFGVDDAANGTERLVAMAERDGTASDEQIALTGRQRVLDAHGLALDDLSLVDRDTLRKSTSGKLSRRMNRALYLERQPTIETESPPPRIDYYVLAEGIEVTRDGDHVILTHPRGSTVTISREMWRLSHRYRIPRALESYQRKARRAKTPEQLQPMLDGAFLVSAGFQSVFGEDDWFAFIANPRSTRLVIQFRGGAYDLVAGVPPREFANKTGVDAHNLLVLRDLRARFYVDGVSPKVPSFEALVCWLDGFINGLGGIEHVYTLGTSMGGYAALRAAHALGAAGAWSFGPAEPRASLGPPLAEVMDAPNGVSAYDVWYCRDYPDDRAVAESIEAHPGVELHAIEGKSHWVAQLLNSAGRLPRLLEPPAVDGAGDPAGPAIDARPEDVLALLRQVIPRAPVTLGVKTPLAGLLDSFGSTHLLSLLRRRYGARIDPARVTDADMASVDAIVRMLRR